MDRELATPLLVLAGALLIDKLFGEYPGLLHPVVWIGKLVSLLLKAAPRSGWRRQFAFGLFLSLCVPALSAGAAWAVLYLAADLPVVEIVLSIFLLKASFALRELGAAAERVRAPVARGDLPGAREALRSLCSRDPTHINAEGLIAATVQSLAENVSDSFVAPLFYYLLFGVPGAVAYRAINTLDSMVGYRGPFEALGKASARLDDAANWIPARLTTVLLFVAGFLTGQDVAGGWRIFRRDRKKTPSPNGGRPMAMAAGLLGVRLEKPGVYILGDANAPLTCDTVKRAWRLVVLSGWLAVGLCALGLPGVHLLRSRIREARETTSGVAFPLPLARSNLANGHAMEAPSGPEARAQWRSR